DGSVFANGNVTMGNARTDDRNLVVEVINCDIFVYAGNSSLQNSALNAGIVRGDLPYYTDVGHLFKIRDLHTSATLVGSIATAVGAFPLGQKATKRGPAILDPFLPGYNYTIIGTQAINQVVNPFQFSSAQPNFIPFTSLMTENSVPVAAAISFTTSTIIDASIFKQAYWQTTDTIYLDTGLIPQTKAQWIDFWNEQQQTSPPGTTFYY